MYTKNCIKKKEEEVKTVIENMKTMYIKFLPNKQLLKNIYSYIHQYLTRKSIKTQTPMNQTTLMQ